jgi:Tol biopolymer transport system component
MTFRLTHVLVAVLAAAALVSAMQGSSAEMMFESARKQEVVDGDLRGAIKTYDDIISAHGGDRGVVARALVAKAQCHDKLGSADGQQLYEQVLRQFADQKEAADLARARLKAQSRGAVSADAQRLLAHRASHTVWAGPNVGIFGGGTISRDGRLLPYIDWSSGNLALRDLASGRDRTLTDTASFADMSRQRYAGYSRISPDGRHIAFGWFNGERYDLRMLDLRAEGISQPRVAYDNPEVSYIQPFDWSPDGTRLAVQLSRRDRTGQIALLSVSDGTLIVLKSFPWRDESTNMFFSPDGLSLGYDLPAEDAPGERDVYVLAADGSRELQVAPHRRNDEMVGWSTDGKRLLFASDRTGSVQLWAQSLAGMERQEPPRVISSEFRGSSKGITSSGALYYLSTTYEGSPFRTTSFDFETGQATATPADPGEEFYSINLAAYADWSPDGTSLALIRRDRPGPMGMLGSVLTLDGRLVRHVRPQLNQPRHPLRWGPDGGTFITAGTDRNGRSGVFSVDSQSGEATPLLLSADGESYTEPALSSDGKVLYYRHVTSSMVRIVARTLESGEERELAHRSRRPTDPPTVLAGLSLSPDGQYIVAGTRDAAANVSTLLAVPVSPGEPRELLSASSATLEVLMWAPDSRSIFVRRRADVEGSPEVVRLSFPGGEPVEVEWTLGHDTRKFRVHPDGRRIVFVQNPSGAAAEVRVMPGVAR